MNKSSKTKDEANIINLDKYKLIGTHWIALYVNGVNMTFFDSFGAEYIQKEITKFIGKSIITDIYRIKAYDWIMCGYFCIWFIYFMIKSKSLFDYTNLFCPSKYEKNNKLILKYFQKLKTRTDWFIFCHFKLECLVFSYFIYHTLVNKWRKMLMDVTKKGWI